MTTLKKEKVSLKKTTNEGIVGGKFKASSKNDKPKTTSTLIKEMQKGSITSLPKSFGRPNFSSEKEKSSVEEAFLATGENLAGHKLKINDLAAPHRAPFAALRDIVLSKSPNVKDQVKSLVDSLCKASIHYETGFNNLNKDEYTHLASLYARTRKKLVEAHENYKESTLDPKKFEIAKLKLIVALNNLSSNAPGLGPHQTANVHVSDNLHLQLDTDNGRLTPRSFQAKKSFSEKDFAVALAANGKKKMLSPDSFLRSYNTISGSHKVVNAGTRVFRGSLFVDENYKVYKPIDHKKATGIFDKDWIEVK